MRPSVTANSDTPTADSPLHFTILYEDRSTGLRAKEFADQVARAHGCPKPVNSVWRTELLEFLAIADEASNDLMQADFVVVSLRGDAAIEHSLRAWLETYLGNSPKPGRALIAIFDPARSRRAIVESARQYFRCLSAETDIPFFCHAAAA